MQKLDQYICILNEIILAIELELEMHNCSNYSLWSPDQLKNIVRPEMNKLLEYALKGKVFFRYGKRQRLLESTYIITDSYARLDNTSLGSKILELQKMYNSL